MVFYHSLLKTRPTYWCFSYIQNPIQTLKTSIDFIIGKHEDKDMSCVLLFGYTDQNKTTLQDNTLCYIMQHCTVLLDAILHCAT